MIKKHDKRVVNQSEERTSDFFFFFLYFSRPLRLENWSSSEMAWGVIS